MKASSKILTLLLAIVMLAALIGGCAPAAPAGQPSASPQVSAPAIQDTDTPQTAKPEGDDEPKPGLGPDMLLLPTMENMADKFPSSWDNYGLVGRMMLFSRVLRLDADLNPVYCDLAESFTASEDGTHYEFKMRDDVLWHDGEKFSAEDVAYSMKMGLKTTVINPVIKGAFRNIKGAAEYSDDDKIPLDADIEGIKVDGNTLIIDMQQPSSTFLLSMAQFNIFPKHIIGEYDLETIKQISKSEFYDWPIGTGPYKVKEFVPNDYAILEYFDDYFGYESAPDIKTVKMSQMTQNDYPVNALSDNIDYFSINDLATALAALENPNYEAFYTDIYFIRYFMWNSTGPKGNGEDPLSDIRVRRAIIHAIDRQSIIDSLMPNQAALTNSKVPSYLEYYNPEVYDLKYDPELAKQLLDEAGYDYDAEIRIACYYSDQGTANFMDAVVEYLNQVGIKASWFLISSDITAQLYDVKDFNLAYAGLSAMAPEEAYNNYDNATLKGTLFHNLFPDDYHGMDELLSELWTTVDANRRVEILKELQIKEQDLMWYMPLFSLKNIQVFNTARVGLPEELVLSNEWSNYERYLEKWTLNAAE